MERSAFLGRVKAARRGAVLPDVVGPDRAPAVVFDDPVGRFVVEAEGVASEVTRVPDVTAAFAAIAAVIGRADTSGFLAWDDLDEVVPGWTRWVGDTGLTQIDATISTDPDQRIADHARVGGAVVGVTSADWGIAATGSVVLTHGPGRPRSASLLVEHHVVLLPAHRVVHSLTEALAQAGWEHTSNIAVITGPSRTGDIESILTLGVHGPRHLHVVLIG